MVNRGGVEELDVRPSQGREEPNADNLRRVAALAVTVAVHALEGTSHHSTWGWGRSEDQNAPSLEVSEAWLVEKRKNESPREERSHQGWAVRAKCIEEVGASTSEQVPCYARSMPK